MEEFDAVVVGAGFGGLYALHRLRTVGLSARVFEAGTDVGGTWYWNRYPGARCDVESLEYSYQFSEELQQEWVWTERYAGQPEILRYLRHVADRFGLRDGIQLDTRVTAARFDDSSSRWNVSTDAGDEVSAQFLIMATGCLSAANMPDVAGVETFEGGVYHTGRWPHEGVDLAGKRVGVVGTGSSGIQSIPVIAKEARELFVFQRTAQYSIPARNQPLDPAEQAAIKADYAGLRARNNRMPGAFGSRFTWNTASALEADPEERDREFETRWAVGGFQFLGAFGDTGQDLRANYFPAEFVRTKIREIVRDPEVAALLSPKQAIGCKRICLDTDYFETFNRPNVHLVDISDSPLEALTPKGLRTGGREYELDCIVFATGYDAMTGALLRVDISGRGGATLRESWAAGPVTYLGLGIPGFPNLFVIAGPGSPSVLANVITCDEQHVEWVTDCIQYLRARGYRDIEATPEAADAWVTHVNQVADTTLYPTCNSWYLGANVPGKPRVFMPLPGYPAYVEKCDDVAANEYEGFTLSK
jgi:cation diffusion facilitator CzcD-associated flavoprotein CzcO